VIKNILSKLIEFFIGLTILLGAIYYIGSTDWWARNAVSTERYKIENRALSQVRSLGSEGLELQNKLSMLIIKRESTTNESELEMLNEAIKKTIDEIQTKYTSRRVENAKQMKDWHYSVEFYERGNRMYSQSGGSISYPVVLKKEWCYLAYQTAYWETAYGHCNYHAKLNDAKAQYLFASILQNGNGVIKDSDGAYVWYSIAALNDYDAAMASREDLLLRFTSREKDSLDVQVTRCVKSNFLDCDG
jgi:TPR repeat protein